MPNAAFAFTGGPINHQTLNTVLATVVRGFSDLDIPVFGMSKGFTTILNGSADRSMLPLKAEQFQHVLEMRGCMLRTERHLPRRSRSDWAEVIEYLVSRDIRYLIVTGGDGTFITLSHLAKVNQQLQNQGRGLHRIVQIPRTMDGDFLKAEFDLGFASALYHGVESLKGFAGDSSLYGGPTVTRMMGRDEGWYALHCAAEFGADMCLIPDEFSVESVDHGALVDALVAHILVMLADCQRFSQILIAEGFWRALRPESQDILGMVRLGEDEHFRIDYKNSPPINLAIAQAIETRLRQLGVEDLGESVSVQQRAVGYAERQRAAVEKDLELAESLGAWAVELASTTDPGLSSAVIALPNKRSRPFSSVPQDGNRVLVDPIRLTGALFTRALSSQVWMTPKDLADEARVVKLAALTRLSPSQFVKEFAEAAKFFNKRTECHAS